MSGRSMPSSRLSFLLVRVETISRYLTLTGLTDSNCTACERKGGWVGAEIEEMIEVD